MNFIDLVTAMNVPHGVSGIFLVVWWISVDISVSRYKQPDYTVTFLCNSDDPGYRSPLFTRAMPFYVSTITIPP